MFGSQVRGAKLHGSEFPTGSYARGRRFRQRLEFVMKFALEKRWIREL